MAFDVQEWFSRVRYFGAIEQPDFPDSTVPPRGKMLIILNISNRSCSVSPQVWGSRFPTCKDLRKEVGVDWIITLHIGIESSVNADVGIHQPSSALTFRIHPSSAFSFIARLFLSSSFPPFTSFSVLFSLSLEKTRTFLFFHELTTHSLQWPPH